MNPPLHDAANYILHKSGNSQTSQNYKKANSKAGKRGKERTRAAPDGKSRGAKSLEAGP